MVIRTFDIKGDNVFDVGLRQGLTGYAGDYGLKAYIINVRKEGKVRVVVSGELDNIECYHEEIKKLDVRIFEEDKKYEVGELNEYEGPDIEWGGYLMAFMGGQMYKGFKKASKTLEDTNQELASIKKELVEIYGRFGVIGQTLEKIDKKIPDGFGQK
jgi:acylphosphatase